MTPTQNPIICALDTPNVDDALTLGKHIAPHVGALKLGLEFYVANGPAGVRKVAACGLPIFLDLKFHDIPNTVAGAVRSALEACGEHLFMLTIHTGGGIDMCRAAAESAAEYASKHNGTKPHIVGVTLLTSLSEQAIDQIGFRPPLETQVLRMASLGMQAGLDGLVCSPHEIGILRSELGNDPALIVPGIRPTGAASDDQKRIMTPEQAMHQGASWLVIGRPITRADNPAAAAQAITASL